MTLSQLQDSVIHNLQHNNIIISRLDLDLDSYVVWTRLSLKETVQLSVKIMKYIMVS